VSPLMDSQTHNQPDGASFKVMTASSLTQVFGQVFETCGFNALTDRVPSDVGRQTATVSQHFPAGCMTIHSFIHSFRSLFYDRSRARFPLPVQTGCGAHVVSSTMGIVLLSRW
jgi:hypothetical protein